MSRRIVSAVLAGLVVAAGVLLAPAPAEATTYPWRFDQRPPGLPATAEPAQTLSSGSATIRLGSTSTSTFDAEVVLGAVPTAATDAVLRISLGPMTGDECRETWSAEVSTYDADSIATRTGRTVHFHARLSGPTSYAVRCGSVSVLAADGSRTVLDQLDEPGDDTVIFDDPGGAVRIKDVDGLRVRPGHWQRVWLRVGYVGSPARGVAVEGEGRRVDVRATTQPITLRDGDTAWVPLRVRLHGARPTSLRIVARPYGALAFPEDDTRRVTLRPSR